MVNRRSLAMLRFLPRQGQYRMAPFNSRDAKNIDIFPKHRVIT